MGWHQEEKGGYNYELNAVLAMVQGSGDQKFYWETRNNTSAHRKKSSWCTKLWKTHWVEKHLFFKLSVKCDWCSKELTLFNSPGRKVLHDLMFHCLIWRTTCFQTAIFLIITYYLLLIFNIKIYNTKVMIQ